MTFWQVLLAASLALMGLGLLGVSVPTLLTAIIALGAAVAVLVGK